MRGKLASALALCALFALSPDASTYQDGPPPARTGGFGEPDCRECHFDRPADSPEGSLTVKGIGGTFEPGGRYFITVELTAEEMKTAGFELSARFAGGGQAGSLAELDNGVLVETAGGVQYARQTLEGSKPRDRGPARWKAAWTAPLHAQGPVVIHVAANAGNGDDSPLGDSVHLVSVLLEPALPPPR